MPDPTSSNTNEELNTAKQVNLDNVGALTREQLTPQAAVEPQGHDHAPVVGKQAGHDHHDHSHAGHSHDSGELGLDEEDEHDHDHGPASANPASIANPAENHLAFMILSSLLRQIKPGRIACSNLQVSRCT